MSAARLFIDADQSGEEKRSKSLCDFLNSSRQLLSQQFKELFLLRIIRNKTLPSAGTKTQ